MHSITHVPTHPLSSPPRSFTATQVDAASNQLANHLITACGVLEGDVVGLMMHRSHNLLLSMLGILKAGGAYLPLDPGHPPSRTAFIVSDAGLKVGSRVLRLVVVVVVVVIVRCQLTLLTIRQCL